jgi:hypothetical protein
MPRLGQQYVGLRSARLLNTGVEAMTVSRRHTLALLAAPLALAACNTVREHKSVYAGLLPVGVQPREAGLDLPLQGLKSRKVAVVLSANFEDYVAMWVNHYERGGAQDRKALISDMGTALAAVRPLASVGAGLSGGGGLFDSAVKSSRQASDPRRVIDRLYRGLQRYFGEVKVATDLGDARAQRVDYIALADLHFTSNAWGNTFLFNGGVHLLDNAVRRIFAVDVSAEAPRTMQDISGAVALQNGLDEISRQIDQALSERLRV